MAERRRLGPKERLSILGKMKGHCAYCGCEISLQEMQIDHILPLKKGGLDTLDNMWPSCKSCNHYKHTLTVEQFRRAIESMPHTLNRDSATYRIAVRYGLVVPDLCPVVFYFEKHD